MLQADTVTDAETGVEAEADCAAVAVVVAGLQPLSLNAVADTVVAETALFQLLLSMNMLLLLCCRTRLAVTAQAVAGTENESEEAAMLKSLKGDDVGFAERTASGTALVAILLQELLLKLQLLKSGRIAAGAILELLLLKGL